MADNMAEYSQSIYNSAIADFRESEYPMLKDSVYLDHAGTTLCSKSLMDAFALDMTSNLYGNPHSSSPSSQLSTSRIEDARMNLLAFFGADSAEYDLVFVANATAGVKLVVDALRSRDQPWLYAYHQACHTSLVGAREEASDSICLDDDEMKNWLDNRQACESIRRRWETIVFSYSAQSHFDGKRYPLSWSKRLKSHSLVDTRIYTLLDASSFVATSPLDLSQPDLAPDFTVMSLYKIFGFPDIGALIIRRSAESLFDRRKYFGGGTVDMVVAGKEKWHAPKSQFLHERLEDGTLPFHSITALDLAMQTHRKLFGSMESIRSHTSHLARRLHNGLAALKHANGEPVCTLYTELDSTGLGNGPIVSFNLRNSNGAWISLFEFEKLTTSKNIHIRTGGVCSPGSIATALDLQPWEIKKNFSAGFRCGAENDIISGKPTGVIRASLGAMSLLSDVERFIGFIQEFYQENQILRPLRESKEARNFSTGLGLRVKAITVFPIKSCAGYHLPPETPWEIRPEGLAWDREWCLVHEGSGHALSQKRCPKMVLMQPSLDFNRGVLRVSYLGSQPPGVPKTISIPLSADPSFFDASYHHLPSRVCGEEISAQIYTDARVNSFFSQSLGLPCVLARFPPGGRGLSSRASKAQMQRHQLSSRDFHLPGSFPGLPSPPDSDSEQQQQPSKILLSNESPILMVHSASVDALNMEIKAKGGTPVAEESFRGNIILEQTGGGNRQLPFSEDEWTSLRIGRQNFKLLGACRRCQMVCIDQETGERREEPFVTLAKTRRFDGKVYFGAHMRHDPPQEGGHVSKETQHPTIQVGDLASVETADYLV